MSSREIKSSEIAQAKGKGVNPVDHVIAFDGIAIIVSKDVTVNDLTIAQIRDIYTGKIRNWKDVGGPNKPILCISRDVSSGTFEVFKEIVLTGATVRDDAVKSASNQAVSTSVRDTPYSIGYIGLGYLSDDFKVLKVNGIEANKTTAKNRTYPIVRSLHLYTKGAPKGDVKSFIDYLLSPNGQKAVDELGFVSIK
jgi:phosphate transport system substrate-binding protein